MARVHLVHGIHTGGPSPVRNLIPILEAHGVEVIYPDYGYILGLETRFANPVVTGALFPYLRPGDLYVGHSNGCAIGLELMRRGAPIRAAAFINGALETDFPIPPQLAHLDVYFNQGDDVTIAAKVAEELGIVDPVYGELGHRGYTGSDPRVNTWDCGRAVALPIVSGHSDWFTPGKVEAWGELLWEQLARFS